VVSPSGRGLVIFLASESAPNNRVHLLDYVVRRHKQVVRTTYSVELNPLIDSIETMLFTQLVLLLGNVVTRPNPRPAPTTYEHGNPCAAN